MYFFINTWKIFVILSSKFSHRFKRQRKLVCTLIFERNYHHHNLDILSQQIVSLNFLKLVKTRWELLFVNCVNKGRFQSRMTKSKTLTRKILSSSPILRRRSFNADGQSNEIGKLSIRIKKRSNVVVVHGWLSSNDLSFAFSFLCILPLFFWLNNSVRDELCLHHEYLKRNFFCANFYQNINNDCR